MFKTPEKIGDIELCGRLRGLVDSVLNEREARIIRLRYGLAGAAPMTQRETAKVCSISRSYVSRLEKKALEKLRSELGDDLKASNDNAVAVIAGANGAKATIVAICGKNAIAAGVKAGDVVREVAKLAGGGGGGRPDSAMAGAKDVSKLDDALSAVSGIVKNIIG